MISLNIKESRVKSFLAIPVMLLLFTHFSIQADAKFKKNKLKETKTSLKTTLPKHIRKASDEKKTSSKDNNSKLKKNTSLEYVLHIETTLGDSRVITGDLPIQAPEKFQIQHIKDGIKYNKDVQLTDIELIEIRRWKGKLIKQDKKGDLYEFQPDRIYVRLKDGYHMLAIGNIFTFLNQFPVYNTNGRVYMFAFWRDLMKKDGSWHTGMTGPTQSRRTCHKDVVRKIKILSVKNGTRKKK